MKLFINQFCKCLTFKNDAASTFNSPTKHFKRLVYVLYILYPSIIVMITIF